MPDAFCTAFNRRCRPGRTAYGHVSDIQRFDVETVRAAPQAAGCVPLSAPGGARVLSEGWPPLLTVSEVAAVLRTSRKAVYAMAERAQLPGVTRIGRRLLVRRDDLLSWLDERRAASPGGTRR
ncbi:MAG: helix-turn-helix domain-containing protein [Polyangiaceae bacterium]